MQIRSWTALGVGLALAASAAGPALAHHSFAMFEMSQEKTISGTVVDFQWTNPHSWIWLDVVGPDGAVQKWGVEGMSPNFLERRGWSKNTLHVGDKVVVTIHPVKSGAFGGSFVKVVLPDGKVMDMMGGQPPIRPASAP
jgi:hypothetical protein